MEIKTTYRMQSDSAERIPVAIHTTADPTATPPEFSMTGAGEVDAGAYEAGIWDSEGFDSSTGRVVAWSAIAGAGQPLPVEGGRSYQLRVRWTVPGGEAPAKVAATIVVD